MRRVLLAIPSFNELERLPKFLETFFGAPQTKSYSVDVLVLDDGSRAPEAKALETRVAGLREAFLARGLGLELHRFERNGGKGHALRYAFEKHRRSHDFIGFLDADGSTPFTEFLRLVDVLESQPELGAVIGSRFKALGYVVERQFKRFLSGRIFATLLSQMFQIPVYDSQCGAKVFRSELMSDSLLAACDNDRWLFDTQLLLYLFHLKLQVLEVPVNWADCPGSKVSLLRDSVRMFWQLWKLRIVFDQKLARISVSGDSAA